MCTEVTGSHGMLSQAGNLLSVFQSVPHTGMHGLRLWARINCEVQASKEMQQALQDAQDDLDEWSRQQQASKKMKDADGNAQKC